MSNPKAVLSLVVATAVTGSIGVLVPGQVTTVSAEEYASPERAEAATGHYARSRSLLIEALREFEAGRQIARPDLIFNPDSWRSSVVAKADELNRVISPQARESIGGDRYRESESLLRQDFDKKAKVTGPRKVAAKKRVAAVIPSSEMFVRKNSDSDLSRARLKENELEPVVADEINEESDANTVQEPAPASVKSDKAETATTPKAGTLARSEKIEKDLRDLLAPTEAAKTETTTPAKAAVAVDEAQAAAKAAPEQKKAPSSLNDPFNEPELANAAEAEISRAAAAPKSIQGGPSQDRESQPKGSETTVGGTGTIGDDEIKARLQKLSEQIDQEHGSN